MEFQLSTVPYYGAFSVAGDLLRKAKYGGNKALIVNPLKRDSKNIMRQVKTICPRTSTATAVVLSVV